MSPIYIFLLFWKHINKTLEILYPWSFGFDHLKVFVENYNVSSDFLFEERRF